MPHVAVDLRRVVAPRVKRVRPEPRHQFTTRGVVFYRLKGEYYCNDAGYVFKLTPSIEVGTHCIVAGNLVPTGERLNLNALTSAYCANSSSDSAERLGAVCS